MERTVNRATAFAIVLAVASAMLLAIAIGASLAIQPAYADDLEGFTAKAVKDGAALTYEGEAKTVKIPDEVDGKTVVECFICENGIAKLDVSECKKLKRLSCNNNKISELDLSNNKQLQFLH